MAVLKRPNLPTPPAAADIDMASLHPPPSAAGNTSFSDSASSSDPRYTPDSNGSEDEYPASRPVRSPVGPLRLQTNFEDDAEAGGPASDIDDENVYDSGEELEGKSTRGRTTPKYTLDEEKEVVRIFDRRLVPFLALLYLLAFLDRSSTSSYPVFFQVVYVHVLIAVARHWQCQNCWP